MIPIKDQFTQHVQSLQRKICKSLEEIDGKAKFMLDVWERPGGGGGESCVMSGGNVFEKGGVSVSVVYGDLSPQAAQQLKVTGTSFFACGLSLVIHPYNPFGKAFGWLIWGVSTGIIIIVGVICLLIIPYINRKKNEISQQHTP